MLYYCLRFIMSCKIGDKKVILLFKIYNVLQNRSKLPSNQVVDIRRND